MNIKIFLKENYHELVLSILMIIIVNVYLICEGTFLKEIFDIIYLNLIIIFIYFIYLYIQYIKWKDKFLKIYEKLLKGEKIYVDLIENDDFYEKLIKETIRSKENEANLKYDILMEKLLEIDEYICRSVHELKIPIATLNMMVDRMDDFKVGNELKNQIEKIRLLTNSMLYGSRSTCLFEDLFIKEENLDKLIKKSIKNNSFFLIENNINVDLKNLNYIVNTDSKWICYVLDQIISNSIKYSKDNSTIDFYAIETEKMVVLHIKDNGIGIEKQDLARIFNKGFTGCNGRNKLYKSTGMGLYFSKKVLNSLGHDIQVDSIKNEYCDLKIYFPKISDYLNVTKK
ncbi:sensor histidine kinase [Clostridium sp. ATCC 25772]|uniref:ATP-binding protein n=1 Tax=Clostridium sp. ATCC 25772 TaxID=1676991 RepID=UPI000781C03F|nr:sensor histidine kinase [Clostridium sp. ATCC 25772]